MSHHSVRRDVDELLTRFRTERTPVVVWGHPEGSHTHSWIHYGFRRALEHLGLATAWMPDTRRSAGKLRDLERVVVITEGQADARLRKMLRPSWLVFGHNCEVEWYRERCDFVPFNVKMLD